MAEHLLFRDPAATGGALVFGADAVAPAVDVALEVALPALAASFTSIPAVRLEMAAALPVLGATAIEVRPSVALQVMHAPMPALAAAFEAQYFSRTARPTVGMPVGRWQAGQMMNAAAHGGHQSARSMETGCAAVFARGAGEWGAAAGRFKAMRAERLRRVNRFAEGARAGAATSIMHEAALRILLTRIVGWHGADGVQGQAAFRQQDALRDSRATARPRWQGGRLRLDGIDASHARALEQRAGWAARHQDAKRPHPGRWVAAPPPHVGEGCYSPGGALRFSVSAAPDGHLVFMCERATAPGREPVAVPVRRVYFVINNVTLHRVPDGAEVPVFSLSLSLDAASWTWGFEASLPASAGSLVDPGAASAPVELLASVNGTAFRVLAESISRERVFGDASIRISGRGRNAALAAPYAPVMNFSNAQARTARQLMDDVLTVNGVPLGWSVDWGLADWNVPAGAFAHQGTWIEALIAIAGAAGGYLMPHPTAQSLRVRHRYPVAPWEWGSVTPDFVLPVDAVARESLRWLEKPAYNRVFVSGQGVGVLGQVTRAGTAGEVLAPMVVDALITEAAAARQRGIAVLADTGRQIEVSLRLPVLAETGIIEPGAFVEYQDGSVTRLGLVRATQVQAGFPEVWQTLGVQAYA